MYENVINQRHDMLIGEAEASVMKSNQKIYG